MSENYTLMVSAVSTLIAPSIWGIMRGLETFSQLFYLSKCYKDVLINSTEIEDYPNYKHRGLLLDTSRHFISVPNILMTLDAMAMNKMNVFHWHIVDDQSFPYQSVKFPELSGLGAYWPTLIYTRPAMEKIRDHARGIGVRVIIEIDMPDHALSWGMSHPEIITVCARDRRPMNPIKNETYILVGALLREVQELFPDTYIHLGGDEVTAECWIENKGIQEYMEKHNMTSSNDLSTLFYKRIVSFLKEDTRTIVWEESYEANVPFARDTLVQVWKNERLTAELLNGGRFVLQSSGYYLDQLGTTFTKFYKVEPRLAVKDKVANETLLQNLVGGEACMWGEMMDDANVISRVWPRTSAIAEVLWSDTRREVTSQVLQRAEEQVCRMKRRRIHAEPSSGPGFCVL
ncbi:beta-hexosaminidase subunit beta-like [Pectinophora gossypiella]|uniref:beta-hexosaminidase subunit beta-like n=1 Tax=Pectinophora gossypiella TaxID=13191 RepID=UPI00214E66D9|nr:beta-hexosaminidase subunit beta-like [Pectinophora gossypiella]